MDDVPAGVSGVPDVDAGHGAARLLGAAAVDRPLSAASPDRLPGAPHAHRGPGALPRLQGDTPGQWQMPPASSAQ